MQLSGTDLRNHANVSLSTFALFNVVFALQVVLAVGYGMVYDVPIGNLRRFFIPFVWLTISFWAIWRTEPASGSRLHKVLGAFGAGGYLFLVMYLSGQIGSTSLPADAVRGPVGFGISWYHTLGWGPILLYSNDWGSLVLVLYQMAGYLTLSYLLYVAMIENTASSATGLVGIVACPSCTGPLLIALLAGAAGTSSALAVLLPYTYELATLLFITAIGVLSWQPSLRTGGRRLKAMYQR